MVLEIWEQCDLDVPFVAEHYWKLYFKNVKIVVKNWKIIEIDYVLLKLKM